MSDIVKTGSTTPEFYKGKHRFEHWFRGNQVYFITARCRGKFNAFASEEAKEVFWNYLEKLAKENGFTLIVVSLLTNHYHILGYAKSGEGVKRMMQRLHGAVAKLVNDVLDERLVPFWSDSVSGKKTYFDGCIRDERVSAGARSGTPTRSASDIASVRIQRIIRTRACMWK